MVMLLVYAECRLGCARDSAVLCGAVRWCARHLRQTHAVIMLTQPLQTA